MNAARIVALVGAFHAAAAGAQPPPPYLVINNTDRTLVCSSKYPGGQWQPWFKVEPAQNWVDASASPAILFQCQPPVAQISYPLQPRLRYSLLPFGAEVRLVEVSSAQSR